MYSGYIPFYRPWGYGYPIMGYGYPVWGYAGYNNINSINAIGSAISNQSLINTGSAIGITQTSTPTVIW
jgi:hypothetical protein